MVGHKQLGCRQCTRHGICSNFRSRSYTPVRVHRMRKSHIGIQALCILPGSPMLSTPSLVDSLSSDPCNHMRTPIDACRTCSKESLLFKANLYHQPPALTHLFPCCFIATPWKSTFWMQITRHCRDCRKMILWNLLSSNLCRMLLCCNVLNDGLI